jgi:3-deoxy-7-phosphoheptulonate synthase
MSKILPFSTTRYEPLISPIELYQEFPANISQKQFVEQSRQQIIRILDGQDKRLLLITGPCSIHDLKAATHYAKKLKELSAEISDVFFPVMRVYFEKSRTSLGWKGLMYDPHLDRSFDLNTGLRLTRELLLILADLQVPTASEILDPISVKYFGDLITWGCIGARTSTSQIHRQAASGLSIPIGFKNNTDGNVDVALQGIITASTSHSYVGINEKGTACVIHSEGNPHCHLVLRGGENAPNYDPQSIQSIMDKLEKAKLIPKIVVDCSHDNSKKDHNRQPEVFESVIDQVISGNKAIKGCILESHLRAGSQQIPANPNLLKYAISLTDSCMDWETTEGIILAAKKSLLSKIPSLKKKKENVAIQSDTQEAALV